MRRSAHRSLYPWLRSVEESIPRSRRINSGLRVSELVAVAVVIVAVVAMAVWFLFFSGGGIGPGTV
jgi:hypothetical protein